MARAREICECLEQLAPKDLAESWDNVGLLVDCGAEVTSVLVALDITDEVVAEAELQGCQLIVAHHPVIFKPLRTLARRDVAFRLVKKNISAICMHTNLDAAEGGVNDVLARLFEVENPEPFGEAGVGRVGSVEPTDAKTLAALCQSRLNAHVKLADAGKPIRRLALIGGSGGSMLADAAVTGADALLTGEASHHDAIDARAMGLSLIVAGHYSTEFPIVPVLADHLSRRFNGLRVICSRRNKDPFSYL